MAGNRTKAEATAKLASMGLKPGWVQEEEAAAFYTMSVNAFKDWQKEDPAAPRPTWFGRCKRYAVSDLGGKGSARSAASPRVSGNPTTPGGQHG